MLVVDTSAVLAALAAPDHPAARALADDPDLHAPHLLDVELQHALGRMVRRAEVTERDADLLRADFRDLAVVRYPHEPLAERMWALRANLTAYDAAFVVLAEVLDADLVTVDERLARAPGHRARIRLTRRDAPGAG